MHTTNTLRMIKLWGCPSNFWCRPSGRKGGRRPGHGSGCRGQRIWMCGWLPEGGVGIPVIVTGQFRGRGFDDSGIVTGRLPERGIS